MTHGFHEGPKLINQRTTQLIQKTTAPVPEGARKELSDYADDLWAQHERAMKSRPVS